MKIFLELLDNRRFSFKLEGFNNIINTDIEITNEDYKKWNKYQSKGKSFRLKVVPTGTGLFDYIEEYIPEPIEVIQNPGIDEFMLETDFRLSKLELGV